MQKTTTLLLISFFLAGNLTAQITFLNFPLSEIVNCDNPVELPPISAYSTCSVDSLVIISVDEVHLEDNCFTTTIREYTATDLCGNQATKSYTVTQIMDVEPPEILNCPVDISVATFADVPQSAPNISVLDNCTHDISGLFHETTEMQCSDCPKVVRTATFQDECANTSECIQTIFITNTSSLPQVEAAEIGIFPNPSSDGNFQIKWPINLSKIQFYIYNSQGQLVRASNLHSNQKSIKGLRSGMYSLVYHKEEKVFVKRLIVQ